ncbi:MAG: ATP-binding protein [Promethearchaeia archaeon]
MLKLLNVRFKQIAYNHINNAIKFTPEGDVSMKEIERRELQVTDTGIDITPENYGEVSRKQNAL